MAAGPGCDAAIRSPSDSYSDAEIVMRAVPLSPEGSRSVLHAALTGSQTWRRLSMVAFVSEGGWLAQQCSGV